MRDTDIIYMSPRWLRSLNEVQRQMPDGRYAPARTAGFGSLWMRIKATWMVWTGRADALIWPGE